MLENVISLSQTSPVPQSTSALQADPRAAGGRCTVDPAVPLAPPPAAVVAPLPEAEAPAVSAGSSSPEQPRPMLKHHRSGISRERFRTGFVFNAAPWTTQ